MQFNIVPRTGGLAINRGKRGVRRHNSHTDHVCSCLVTSAAQEQIDQSCDDCYPKYRFTAYQRIPGLSESLFYFCSFTLLTSLLVKYSHSHPPYSLRNLRSLATFIHSAQRHHAHPLLTFFFPFMNSRIPPRTRSE